MCECVKSDIVCHKTFLSSKIILVIIDHNTCNNSVLQRCTTGLYWVNTVACYSTLLFDCDPVIVFRISMSLGTQPALGVPEGRKKSNECKSGFHGYCNHGYHSYFSYHGYHC